MLLNCGVGEDSWENPLDCKEIKPVHPGYQSWIFIGRTDVEAETPILWPPDAKNGLIGKDPDARKDWRQEEKRTTEDELFGWHHPLSGHGLSKLREFMKDREALSPWGHKKSDMTERLNWTELNLFTKTGVDPTGVVPQGSEGRVTVITPRPEGKRGDTYSKPEERIL